MATVEPLHYALAIIGCGKLGSAVLQGLSSPDNQGRTLGRTQHGHWLLEHILVSVRDQEKADHILGAVLTGNPLNLACPVEFVVGDNIAAARRADIVFLACHPHQAAEVLGVAGMADALAGKLLISMLGGVSVAALENALYGRSLGQATLGAGRCHILQAIPNIAAARRKSTTVVGEISASIPEEVLQRGHNLLRRIGDLFSVDRKKMPAATALCASGTAFFAWFAQAMVEAAVSEGIEEGEAARMAASTMAGAAYLIASGEPAAGVMARVTTPGGATARGLAVLDESNAKEIVSKALGATTSKIRS